MAFFPRRSTALRRSSSCAATPRRKYRPTVEVLEERIVLVNRFGDMPDGMIWDSTDVQRVTGDVHVPAGNTLTIQAGTVVKFDSGRRLTVDGTLKVLGSDGQKVVFTSIADDSVGGDTNGNGSASSPHPGDWNQILFTASSTGSVLDHVVVAFGGSNFGSAVRAENVAPTISNSTLRDSLGYGVHLLGSTAALPGDTFQNNGLGAVHMDPASSPTISTPTLTNNGVNGVLIDGGTISSNRSWNNPGIVYVMNDDITVAAGATLTVGAGQIVKQRIFNGGINLFVSGTLSAPGTVDDPVIFTSLEDDTVGGDTNNDAANTLPAAGEAGGLSFLSGSTGSVLDHVEVRYGGNALPAGILVHQAELTLTNSLVRNTNGAGLRIESSNPTVTGTTFTSNSSGAITMDLASSPTISTPTLSTNGINGVVLDGGTILSNRSWNNPGIVYTMNNDITVAAGATLTVGAGQVVKQRIFNGGINLFVSGTLSAQGSVGSPVIFTSLEDDTVGGDTNNDAAGSVPAAGEAGGLSFLSGSTGSVLDHVEVRYGGNALPAGILVHQAELTLTNSLVRNTNGAGLRIESSNPTVTGSTFTSNSSGAITMDPASNPTISTPTLTNNGVNGVLIDGGTISGNRSWNNPDIVYVMRDDITVAAGATLTVGAGQIVKQRIFNGGINLFVSGTLSAPGTVDDPVIFTSLEDDTVGGDTNNDVGGSVPAAGEAGGLSFLSGSTGSVLDHVEVRYSGNALPAGIVVHQAELTLTNSLVRDTNGAGLRIESSNPTVTGSTFRNNPSGAITMDLASSPTISTPTLTNNGVNGVVLDNGTITTNTTWNNPTVPYFVNSIRVDPGVTLTIGAGQVIKVTLGINNDFTIKGTLLATGTEFQPITFTSIRDDSALGDTNNDGNATGTGVGLWNGLTLDTGSNSVLNHVRVRYAGSNTAAQIYVRNAALTMNNGVVSDGNTAGLFLEGSNAILTGVTFKDNFGSAIRMNVASTPVLNGLTFTNNPTNGVAIDNGTITTNTTWNNPTVPYFVNSIRVDPGVTLTIGAGQVIKVTLGINNDFTIKGTLLATGTEFQPITFTSIRDDSALGDTNNDGNTTSPGVGLWNGLFLDTGSNSVLNHVRVRYAGSNSAAQIYARNAALSLSNSVVSDGNTAGLFLEGSSATLTGDTFLNHSGPAIRMDAASNPAGSGTTATGNTVNGLSVTGGTLAGNVTWATQGLAYSLSGGVTIPQGNTLTIAAGTQFVGAGSGSFNGTGTIANAGSFVMAAPNNGSMSVAPQLINTGVLDVRQGTLDLNGGLVVNGSGVLTGNAAARLNIRGNLSGDTGNVDQFTPGVVNFDGGGTVAVPQTLEVMSKDLGNTAAGFVDNVTYYTLSLANSTRVKLTDASDNTPGTGAEAIYVNTLSVPAGSTLDLNGLHLYARNATVNGTVTGGTISTLGDGGLLVRDTPTTGRIATSGEMDDWTTYGRQGETLTVTLSTGGSGIAPPLPPTLNFGQVRLLDPQGNVLATQNNTASGADVTLTGINLPTDGAYHIQVKAAPLQPSNTGSYSLAAWDAAVNTTPLVVNENAVGRLNTPFRVDRWTFSATAGQAIRFVMINEESSAIQFDLTGPNGYTAFANVNASSDTITLPSNDTYTVTVHGTQKGAYAFRIEQVSVTDLTLGTPVNGVAVGGQAQLYRVNVPAMQQLQIKLTDNTATDRNEVYVKFGGIPTRSDFLYQFTEAASASQSGQVPSAAPGFWYVLVYTSVGQGSNFSLQASGASVFLTSVAPDHAGNGADMALTLAGVGFDNATTISLISSGNVVYAANSNQVHSPTQVAATFNAGSVPPGTYNVRATTANGSTTLTDAFRVVAGGQANLVTNLIVPNPIGRHIASVIYVEYANTGDLAMPAPLLVLTGVQNGLEGAFLTLDAALQTSGFWTSAVPRGYSHSVQILASGATPGVLQPGESISIPVYYAGWLESQWDFSLSPITFSVGLLTSESTAAVDWPAVKSSLQPPGIDDNAWEPIYANLTAQLGPSWGSVIASLDQDAAYLGTLGKHVTDVGELWAFEIQQANGLGIIPTLAASVDMAAPAVGLPLGITRSFGSSIIDRNVTGPFGNGWQLGGGWERALSVRPDGTVVIDSTGARSLFQPDSRGGYFAQTGDFDVLASLGGGAFTLTTPSGGVTRFQDGRVAFVQDTNGNRITAGYTGGRWTSLTASSGESISLTYNGAGRITGLTNSLGQTASYSYDPTNQYLLSATDYNGYTSSYTYDLVAGSMTHNALRTVTNPDGTQELFGYDTNGRLSETSLQGGAQAVHFGYGTAGTVTVTDAANHTSSYFFDHRSLVAKTIDPLDRVAHYAYDTSGHVVSVTNPAGAIYSYVYDSHGRRIRATNPLGQETNFSYGPLDRLTSATDPKGNTTRYKYDPRGNLTSTTYADGALETAAYNPIGQLIESNDADHHVIGYAYNAAGQLTTKTYADNSQTILGYDALGNLTSVVDATGTTMLTYDGANRLKKITYPDSTFLSYSYDTSGRRTQMVDQTGFTVNYHYNGLGQFSGLTDGANQPIVSYSYDAAGRLQEELKGNGTVTRYGYNAADELTSIVNKSPGGTVNSSFLYTYDNLGLCFTETTLQGQWVYTYDAIGQLTHAVFTSNNPAQVPNRDERYNYDAAGNRTSTVINGVTTAYTVNNRNEYTQVGQTAYSYSPAGNLTSSTNAAGATTYSYDADGRLVSVQPPSGTASSIQYDALGGVYTATQNGPPVRYLTDPQTGNVIGQLAPGGSVLAHYTYGFGLVSQVSAAGAANYYDFDLRGSTVGMSNPAGEYVNTYSYAPFGGILDSTTTIANPFQFVGRWGVVAVALDANLMGVRFYDSSIGQFLTDDPIGLAGGDLNLRRYVNNNPATSVDPLGTMYVKAGISVLLARLLNVLVQLVEKGKLTQAQAMQIVRIVFYFYVEHETLAEKKERLDQEAYENQRRILEMINPLPKAPETNPLPMISWPYSFTSMVPAPTAAGAGPTASSGSPSSPPPGGDIVPIVTTIGSPPLHAPPAGVTQNVGTNPVEKKDPNGKGTIDGFGAANFVVAGQVLPYRVDFENDPTATAPCQIVTVTDQLDVNLDWNTFALTAVGFGDVNIVIPLGTQHFRISVPIIDNGKSFNVDIELGIRLDSGEVYARFYSLDPATSLPPDVLTGFLPPEDGTGRGGGYFSYLIQPKTGLASGTAIRNVASVIFDPNEAITTDQIDPHDASLGVDPAKQALVTIDASGPTSSIAALPANSPASFPVSWTGSDDAGGSGVGTVEIWVSDNNAPFTLWRTVADQTPVQYPGAVGHTYRFYSVATDNVGHREATPAGAQATTFVAPDSVPPTSSVAALPAFGPAVFTLQWSGSDDVGGSGIATYDIFSSDNGGPFTALLTGTMLTSVQFTGQSGHTYGFYSVAVDNAGNRQPTPGAAQTTTTVDTTAPTSNVAALPAFSTGTFAVNWSGSDNANGSGVASYDVLVSDNGGPFTLFRDNTSQTTAMFTTGVNGHTYRFNSIATDNVGNQQPTPGTTQTTTVDTVAPTSSVSLPNFTATTPFTVTWSSGDGPGSGVVSYDVFVSDNGGPFMLFQTATTQPFAQFTGVNGHTYGFYSIAIDNAGNRQPTPAAAQATTSVDTAAPTSSVAALSPFSAGTFAVNWSGSDNLNGSGITGYDVFVSDNGGAVTLFRTGTTQTTAMFTGGINGHTYEFYSVALDNAGNRQPTPAAPQAITIVDTAAPSSTVAALPTTTDSLSFTVSWSGNDGVNGSGVTSFDVFVSVNGFPFMPYLQGVSQTSANYDGLHGLSYGFYSVATDLAGNREATPAAAQATIQVNPLPPHVHVTPSTPAPSPPPPPVSAAGLAVVKRGKKVKKKVATIQFTDGSSREITLPFQAPGFASLAATLADSNGDGRFDALSITARKGTKKVSQLVML